MGGQDKQRRESDNTPSGSRQLQPSPQAPDSKRARVVAAQAQPPSPSATAAAAPAQVTPCPTAGYFREIDTQAKLEECFLAISADLHVKPVDACEQEPQSLTDFRGLRSTTLLLTRMSEQDAKEALAGRRDVPLASLVEGLVGKKNGFGGRALRVRGQLKGVRSPFREKQEWVVLVAASQQQRDSWLHVLQTIVAPWSVFEEAMRAALSCTPCAPSVTANAAGSSLQTSCVQGSGAAHGSTAVSSRPTDSMKESALVASIARGSEALVAFANSGNSVASFGATVAQAIADIAGTADKLSTQLGSLALVAPALLGISVLARTTQMLASARANEPNLQAAHRVAQNIRSELGGVLRVILETGFRDENLVEKVFRFVEETWDVIVLLERHMLKSFVGRALKANEVAPILATVQRLADKGVAVGVLRHVAELKKDISELELLRVELQSVVQRVERTEEEVRMIKSRQSAEKREDSFKASYSTIPILSRRVIFDGIPGLAALKKHVLGSSSVAASGVAAKGDGGVGKTTACIAIARDADVQAYFVDGIYFISLGEAASDASVVAQVSRIVDDCGGTNVSKEIEAKPTDVTNAVDKARRWFQKRHMLLIVDNVWPRSSSSAGGGEWASTLATIVGEGPRRCFLFSTRMTNLASFAEMEISFECFDMSSDDGRKGAISMFEVYARIERAEDPNPDPRFSTENEEYQGALDTILQICNGWQLLLAMAGAFASARKYHWNSISADLQKHLSSTGGVADGVLHSGLRAIMETSMTFVESLSADDPNHGLFGGLDTKTMRHRLGETWFTNIYSMFSIYESPRFVLIPVLAVHLGVDESEARTIAYLFEEMGLAAVREADFEGHGKALRLSVHDMQLAYATSLCGNSDDRPKHSDLHAALLDRVAEKIGEGNSDRAEVNWSLLFEGERCIWRGYCQTHLARHMLSSVGGNARDGSAGSVESEAQRRARQSSRAKIVVSFLTDYRWIRGCGKVRGRGGLLVDFRLFAKSAGGWPASVQAAREAFFGALPSGASRAVEITGEIIAVVHAEDFNGDAFCATHRRRRDRGLASQLYGRLKAVEDGEVVGDEERESFRQVVQSLQESVVSHARRPWLRATSKCYDPVGEVGEHLKEAFSVSDKSIRRVAFLNLDMGRRRVVVSGGLDGKVRLHDLDDVGRSAVELGAHEVGVFGIAVSDGGGSGGCPLVASCSLDGAVCIWDASPVLRNFGEAKSSGAGISAVDDDLRVATLLEENLGVRGAFDVSISADGSRVFAADRSAYENEKDEIDWRIHLWTRRPRSLNESGAAASRSLSYDHKVVFEYSTPRNIKFCHVAISKGGETALHCEWESGVLRVWRTSDGKLLDTSNVLRSPVDSAEGDEVYSILLSDDAATLYAGTDSGRIQVFDARRGEVVGCMHSKNVVTSGAPVTSMALVECKGSGEGAQPAPHLLSAHYGGAITRWSVETQSPVAVYGASTGAGSSRAISELLCMTVRNGGPARPGAPGDRGIDGRAPTAAGIEIVTGYRSGKVARWVVEEREVGQKQHRVESLAAEKAEKDNNDIIRTASCSRDGRLVACGMGSGRVSLWHSSGQGRMWISADACEGSVSCIDISNDNKFVAASGSGRDILVLDGASGQKNCVLSVHTCDVQCVIFPRGGKYLASGDSNGRIFLWDMNFPQSPIEVKSPDGEANTGIYILATAAASEAGNAKGENILVSVDESWECWVWSLFDRKLLFKESLASTKDGHSAGDGVVDAVTSGWGWNLCDWRERRHWDSTDPSSFSARWRSFQWRSFQVGQGSQNAEGTMRIESKLLANLLPVIGPTGGSGSLQDCLCPCFRNHVRFDTDFWLETTFACSVAAVPPSPSVVGEDGAAVDSVANDLPAGAVLLGCGLRRGKLATFQLMTYS